MAIRLPGFWKSLEQRFTVFTQKGSLKIRVKTSEKEACSTGRHTMSKIKEWKNHS